MQDNVPILERMPGRGDIIQVETNGETLEGFVVGLFPASGVFTILDLTHGKHFYVSAYESKWHHTDNNQNGLSSLKVG